MKMETSGADSLISLIDELFADFNMGFLIYHIEDLNDVRTLKLIYANQEASKYTGADLQPRVGKYIHEAFPALEATEIPKAFHDVILKKEAMRIGMVDYSDEQVEKALTQLKPFPCPINVWG